MIATVSISALTSSRLLICCDSFLLLLNKTDIVGCILQRVQRYDSSGDDR